MFNILYYIFTQVYLNLLLLYIQIIKLEIISQTICFLIIDFSSYILQDFNWKQSPWIKKLRKN